MRKSKLEPSFTSASLSKNRSFQILLTLAFIYLFFLLSQFPSLLSRPSSSSAASTATAGDPLRSEQEIDFKFAPKRPSHLVHTSTQSSSSSPSPKSSSFPTHRRAPFVSGLRFGEYGADAIKHKFSEIHRVAKEAWDLGRKNFRELNNLSPSAAEKVKAKEEESCPSHVTLTGAEFAAKGKVMVIPCGLTLGSHITLVATPYPAHPEYDPKIALKEGDQAVMVSQFMMELQGLKTVDGEEPPKILHFNPRLKGDWSGRPVIEQNTCYRMQWHTALRCEGWRSRADEETGKILSNLS